VLVTASFSESPYGADLIGRLRRAPLEVEPELLASLTDADSPRGCVAVAQLPRPGIEALSIRPPQLGLLLDGVQDPGNLGAIARVAEAFGVGALLLTTGACHPNHPRALRASAGSLLRLPVAVGVAPGQIDANWSEAGSRLRFAALDAHGGTPLPKAPLDGPTIVVLGPERGGFSAGVETRLDERWTIPVAPTVDSLNVAVAAGIALFALAGAR